MWWLATLASLLVVLLVAAGFLTAATPTSIDCVASSMHVAFGCTGRVLQACVLLACIVNPPPLRFHITVSQCVCSESHFYSLMPRLPVSCVT